MVVGPFNDKTIREEGLTSTVNTTGTQSVGTEALLQQKASQHDPTNSSSQVTLQEGASSTPSPSEDGISTTGLGIVNDGIGGLGEGTSRIGGTVRLTNGPSNGSQLSVKHYPSGWAGGSKARITTYGASTLGTNIGRASIVGSLALGAYNINEANIADGRTFGYNTQVATARTAGGLAGGWVGAKAGAVTGAAVGVWFGGGGAVPGALIGGVVGGVTGGWAGGEASQVVVDELHNK